MISIIDLLTIIIYAPEHLSFMDERSLISRAFYPSESDCPSSFNDILRVFESNAHRISTIKGRSNKSNEVLSILSKDLIRIGFDVENSYGIGKIPRTVLAKDGKSLKKFNLDAYNKKTRTDLEIEAGRAVDNYNFLRDLFQASLIEDVDYLVIAVRIRYRDKPNYDTIKLYLDSLYSCPRMILPLNGILLVGY